MAQSKIELILDMKDRMTTALKKAKDAVSSSTEDMKQKMRSLKTTFVNALAEMRAELPGLDKALRLMHNPIMLLTTAIGAVGAGVSRLRQFASESIETYRMQAEAETKLGQVMRNTMGARQTEIDSIKQLASEQQRLGVIGDEVQLAGAQELGTYLTKADNLKTLLPVLNDMVAQQYGYNATQESAVNIATMMGKVMDGQVGALSRYGYKFDEAQEKILRFGTEEQRAATLADVVSESVGGVNAALARTPEGALKQYENDLGDLQESFGQFFTYLSAAWLPVKQAFMNGWQKVAGYFERNRAQIMSVVQSLASHIATVISGVFTVIGWLKSAVSFIYEWRDAIYGAAAAYAVLNARQIAAAALTGLQAAKTAILTGAQWLLNVAMSANPIGIIIVLIGALIGIIVALCRRYEGWTTVWNATKITLVNGFMQYVATWKAGLTELWYDVQIFWERLKNFGEYVGKLFSNIAKAIKMALSFNFSAAKQMLTQKITTTASVRIKELEEKRDAARQQFKDESLQRAKEVADAWRSVELKRKTEAAEEETGDVTRLPKQEEAQDVTSYTPDSPTESIAGSAKQIRNITVNIEAFNKGGINTTNTDGLNGMSASDIEEWFNQMLLRSIRNLELSY